MSLGIKKTVTSKARKNTGVIKSTIMFEKIEYIVKRIDGDYAYLKNVNDTDEDEKCVARALLPAEISEGTELVYEMLEYSIK